MATLPTIVGGGFGGEADDLSTAISDVSFTPSTNNETQKFRIPDLVTTATGTKSVSAQIGNAHGLAFKSDGTKMYVVDVAGVVYQYSLSTAWLVSSATYDSVSFSVAAQTSSSARTLNFSSDGTKMYVQGAKTIYQYTLSTAWNLATASYASKSFSTATQLTTGTDAKGVAFSSDGTKMYVSGNTTPVYYQYTLSTAWDVSTASYASISLTNTLSAYAGLAFTSDGLNLYAISGGGAGGDTAFDINHFVLGTAWNISTAVPRHRSGQTDGDNPGDIAVGNSDATVYTSDSTATTSQVNQYNKSAATPSDFASMSSLSWHVRVAATGGWADDTFGCDVRVMANDDTTVLAAADSSGGWVAVSNAVTSTQATFGPTAFAYVNTTATKSQWDNAYIHVRQRFTVVMSADGARISLYILDLTGTYAQTGTPINSSDTGSGADAASAPTVATAKSSSDTGSGADTSTRVALSNTDTGSGADAQTVRRPSSPVELHLKNPLTLPTVDTGHSIRVRAWIQSGDTQGTLNLELRQGVTVIESWSEALTTSAQTFEHAFSSTNIANITDYNDLRLRATVVAAAGAVPRISLIREAQPVGTLAPTAKSDSDTGSGSDATAPRIALSNPDTGSGADTTAPTIRLSSSDTGSGSDAAAPTIRLSSSDTGSGADTTAPSIRLADTDTGSGADNGTAVPSGITKNDSDTSTGSDATAPRIGIATTETSTGADGQTIQAPTSGADTGAGSDATAPTRGLSNTETGTGSEVLPPTIVINHTETGAGVDAVTRIALTNPDTGAGSEVLPPTIVINHTETGAGVDAGQNYEVLSPTGDILWTGWVDELGASTNIWDSIADDVDSTYVTAVMV